MKKIKISLLAIGVTTLVACGSNETVEEVVEEPVATEVEATVDYLSEGQKIVQQTFKVMGAKIKQSIAENGVPGTLDYCKQNAGSLIDSLAKSQNVVIRRTSNQLRNPENAASEEEKEMLDWYASQTDHNPIVKEHEGYTNYYQPIKMKALCLNCHGVEGETLTAENYQKISDLYPEDQAINYKEGDLRGIWNIEFKNQ